VSEERRDKAELIAKLMRRTLFLLAMLFGAALLGLALVAPAESIPGVAFLLLGVGLPLLGLRLRFDDKFRGRRRIPGSEMAQRTVDAVSVPGLGLPWALAGALLPLLVPLAVVAVLGSKTWGWTGQVIAALALLATLSLLHFVERRAVGDTAEVIDELLGRSRLAWLVAGGIVLAVGVYVLNYERRAFQLESQYGFRPATFGVFGAALFVVAAVMRLVGFATNLSRALLVLVFVAGFTWISWTVGVGPREPALDAVTRRWWVVPVVVVVAIVAASLLEVALGQRGTRWFRDLAEVLRVFRAIGIVAVCLSAAFFVIVVLNGMFEAKRAQEALPHTDARELLVPGGSVAALAAVDHGRPLAATYLPELVLTERERWTAVAVEDVLPDMLLVPDPPNGLGRSEVAVATLPARCNRRDGCWRLLCKSPGSEECLGAETHPAGLTYREGAVYARVLTQPAGESNPALAGATYGGQRIEALVQYWLFYRYDDWIAPTIAGVVQQKHEGDWEAAMVAFSRDRPLFVAYTSHCGGNWYPWDDVSAAQLPRSDPPQLKQHYRTHPIVAVAEGSHANYNGATVNRTPDWGSCEGIGTSSADVLSFAANLRDRTQDGWRQVPAEIVMVEDPRGQSVMDFKGHWGGEDETDLLGTGRVRRLVGAKGPTTPSLKFGLWNVPVETILCNPRSHWHAPSGATQVRCDATGG
jgi:hypothetical protein